MGKKVGLTYDLKEDWVLGKDDPIDANAEFDSMKTVDRIKKALESGGHTIKKIGNFQKLSEQINNLGVDIVFNICEGRGGRSRESQVPLLLEAKGIPCVGADSISQGITLDKVFAKKMFIADEISTPRYFVAKETDDLKTLNTIGYPLIVKTRHEGTSKGLTLKSRVENLEQLKEQVVKINRQYKQTALVEEFIKGTEFTVAVLGNENAKAMPVVQTIINGNKELGNDFYTYEMVSSANSVRYTCPAQISASLSKKLQDLALKAYKSIECRDFGRVDFRVDEKGNAYILEINPLPTLDERDVFNLFPQVIGTTYDATINQILNFALERYGMFNGKHIVDSLQLAGKTG